MKLKKNDDLPPSPLDPMIRALDVADFITIGAALFCGWQLGDWWGVALATALLAADLIDGVRTNLHREELLELIGHLAAERTQSLRL